MEFLDIFDENLNKIGSEERSIVHEQGYWHIHVGAWLMNEKGELLFQKRAKYKKINPGKWTRTGGHVDAGETPRVGIQREVEEEIGVKLLPKDFELISIEKQDKSSPKRKLYGRHFVYSYFAFINTKIADFKLQESEVEEVKYMSIEEIEEKRKEKDDSYTFVGWQNQDLDKQLEFLKEKRKRL